MKPHPECGLCMMKWVYERVGNSLGEEKQFAILKKLAAVFAAEAEPSMNMGILCNRSVAAVYDSLLASSGFYAPLKRKSNEAAEALIGKAKAFIEKSASRRERFVKACGLAAVSNVAPIGVPSASIEFTMVEDIIKGAVPLPMPAGDIYDAVSKARNVFYVADNAGEIGFDSLVISLLKVMGAKVTLAVKEGPFFDDATPEDARYFGLEQIADAVHAVRGGIFVPDTAEGKLARLFEESDLVISKGTGNFEVFKGYGKGKPVLFLLKAKCRPVSQEAQTPEGEFVVRLEGWQE
jgi:damage-control phosphatase, subfamily I